MNSDRDADVDAGAEDTRNGGRDDHGSDPPTPDAHEREDVGGGHEDHEDTGPGHPHADHGDHDHPGHDHAHASDVDTVGVGVVTVSSSRSLDNDPAGDAITAAFEDDGHEVAIRELIADSFDNVQATVTNFVARDDVDFVVTTGGTGVTPDDVTVEAVRPLLGKVLPGFGELFRRLSYEEVGTSVVATRAIGGIAEDKPDDEGHERGVPVFCVPGSENAARLATEEILVPEAEHLVGLARRVETLSEEQSDDPEAGEHPDSGSGGE